MRRRRILLFAAMARGAGGGPRRWRRPPAGACWPVTRATAATVPTADQLLTPPVQTRPGRSDELLKKSEERQDDRFDLPPPG